MPMTSSSLAARKSYWRMRSSPWSNSSCPNEACSSHRRKPASRISNTMGQSLNLRVIAEGVETAEDLEFLWAHDCDEAQGNFFSRPVPADQMVSLLQSR